jgi:DNA anti-recombination protein RmuC
MTHRKLREALQKLLKEYTISDIERVLGIFKLRKCTSRLQAATERLAEINKTTAKMIKDFDKRREEESRLKAKALKDLNRGTATQKPQTTAQKLNSLAESLRKKMKERDREAMSLYTNLPTTLGHTTAEDIVDGTDLDPSTVVLLPSLGEFN